MLQYHLTDSIFYHTCRSPRSNHVAVHRFAFVRIKGSPEHVLSFGGLFPTETFACSCFHRGFGVECLDSVAFKQARKRIASHGRTPLTAGAQDDSRAICWPSCVGNRCWWHAHIHTFSLCLGKQLRNRGYRSRGGNVRVISRYSACRAIFMRVCVGAVRSAHLSSYLSIGSCMANFAQIFHDYTLLSCGQHCIDGSGWRRGRLGRRTA